LAVLFAEQTVLRGELNLTINPNVRWITMTKALIITCALAFLVLTQLATVNTANAAMSIEENFTKTTITLNETVQFSAKVSFPVNITWYCNDVLVQSDFAATSNYTFIPKTVGTYYVKLSVAGFTKPSGPTKVTVVEQTTSPSPTRTATPTPYPIPTPHSTYHKGDSYTTVFSPSQISPPNGTKPLKVTIKSITNNTSVSTNNFTLTFSLALEGSFPITLQTLSYKTSWQPDNASINYSQRKYSNETLTFDIPFFNVPEGEQSITINADTMSEFETGTENARKPVSGMPNIPPYGNYFYVYSNYYFVSGQSFVNFTVDTSPAATSNPTSGYSQIPKIDATVWASFIFVLLTASVALLFYRRHRKISN
jgi:hypothetical protein